MSTLKADPVAELKKLGRDLSKTRAEHLPKELYNVTFIIANSYRSFRQNVGTEPLNDAVAFAKCAKYFESEVFYLHNPHSMTFMKYLEHFVSRTFGNLIIYYVGEGTTERDLDRTISKFDEVFTFEDGVVTDEDFASLLADCKPEETKITLITDTCHENTAWFFNEPVVDGINLPSHIVAMSTTPDIKASRQMLALSQEQGIFTFNMTKSIKANPKITPNQMFEVMKPVMAKYSQNFHLSATSPEDLDQPILPPVEL